MNCTWNEVVTLGQENLSPKIDLSCSTVIHENSRLFLDYSFPILNSCFFPILNSCSTLPFGAWLSEEAMLRDDIQK